MEQQHRRHDGTSPLPFAMDWSHPPFKWNGRNTMWPQDSHIGWRYCVTIPTWVITPQATDMDPVL
nr:PX domain-containing protein EREL1-like isoform X1 [Tanacetum cinerariifolium]